MTSKARPDGTSAKNYQLTHRRRVTSSACLFWKHPFDNKGEAALHKGKGEGWRFCEAHEKTSEMRRTSVWR